MRALIARTTGAPSVLEVIDVPAPAVGTGRVRIRVAAAALNRIDLSVRAGYLLEPGLLAAADRYHFGWDVAGTVDATGPGVTRFGAGDRVVGLRDRLSTPGTHAELVVLDESAVAPAPRTVDLVTAAALPLGALTAGGALRRSGVGRGDTLLVTGAGGVVGRAVLELAALAGVEVVAHARPADGHELGHTRAHLLAEEPEALATAVRRVVPGGVDAVIDCANLAILAHEALRGEGTFVSLVRPLAPPPLRGTTVTVHEAHADGARLAELAALVDSGVLSVRVADELPLEQAARAHELLTAGGVRGRIVLVP